MSSYKYRFTIFTPCYNSEKFIHRVYDSLEAQSFRDFEWLVINDASTDGTSDILHEYRKKASFPVRLIELQQNQMLMKNFNLAVQEAQGEFFLTAGHDDAFESDALYIFNGIWNSYNLERQSSLSGVICNCKDQYGKLIGTEFPSSPLVTNIFHMRLELKVKGEKWGFTRTSIMREFPFNTLIDQYVPEFTVWNAIGSKYDTVHINDALRIYYRNEDEHVSLSNSRTLRFINGYRFGELEILNRYVDHYYKAPKELFFSMLNYIRLSLHCSKSFTQIIGEVHRSIVKVFIILLFPLGMAKAQLDKLQGRI